MQKTIAISSTLLLLAVAASPPAGLAEDVATGPYRELCRPLGMTVGGDGATLQGKTTFVVSSRQPGVKPADIRITIRTPEESIPIPVAADGVMDLPISQKWFDDDAVIVSNVPKGTLRIRGVMQVGGDLPLSKLSALVAPHLDDGAISYVNLMKLARDHRQNVLKAVAEEKVGKPIKPEDIIPERPDEKWVLVLWATEDADSAEATLKEKAPQPPRNVLGKIRKAVTGSKSNLRKVAEGVFVLKYSEALANDDPLLSLSQNPSWSCAILTADQVKQMR